MHHSEHEKFQRRFPFPASAAFLLLALALLCTAPLPARAELRDVSAREAARILQQRDDVIVLDVRTQAEYDEGHIADARLIPVSDDDFRERLDALDRDATYLVHCRSGRRSIRAVEIMREKGFQNILHMTGGILEWKSEGLPLGKE